MQFEFGNALLHGHIHPPLDDDVHHVVRRLALFEDDGSPREGLQTHLGAEREDVLLLILLRLEEEFEEGVMLQQVVNLLYFE